MKIELPFNKFDISFATTFCCVYSLVSDLSQNFCPFLYRCAKLLKRCIVAFVISLRMVKDSPGIVVVLSCKRLKDRRGSKLCLGESNMKSECCGGGVGGTGASYARGTGFKFRFVCEE
jgi:hypothetical protein